MNENTLKVGDLVECGVCIVCDVERSGAINTRSNLNAIRKVGELKVGDYVVYQQMTTNVSYKVKKLNEGTVVVENYDETDKEVLFSSLCVGSEKTYKESEAAYNVEKMKLLSTETLMGEIVRRAHEKKLLEAAK